MNKQKNVIQNDVFLLFKCISDTFEGEDLQRHIQQITSIMDINELSCLLKVFKELQKTKITTNNLEFIICNSNLLNEMFFENEKLSKEKMELLNPPYDELINISYFFAKYCLNINLRNYITTNHFNIISHILMMASNNDISILEKCISNFQVPILDIAKSSELFLRLFMVYHKIFDNINLDILVTTAFNIYKTSAPEIAEKQSNKYLYSIKYMNEDGLNNMNWFLENFPYCEYNTLLDLLLCNQLWNSKIFELDEKKEILNYMIDTKYYPLMLKSANIALKFYLLEKETGQKPDFNVLKDLHEKTFKELEKII